jgi:hypothetical protein
MLLSAVFHANLELIFFYFILFYFSNYIEFLNLGYSCWSYKKRQFQIANLLEVDFKSKKKILNKYFTSCNVSKCLCGS